MAESGKGASGNIQPEEAQSRRIRQLEILVNASRNIHASLDTPAVMRPLLTSGMELVDATAGTSGLMIKGKMVFIEYNSNGAWTPIDYTYEAGRGVPGWLIENRRPYISHDAEHDPQVDQEARKALGFYNLIDVPVIGKEGTLLGCFHIHNSANQRPFDEQDIAMLESLAASAAMAIENARISDEQKRDHQSEQVLNRLLQISLETTSLDEALERALDAIIDTPWLPIQHMGAIFLVEDEPPTLVMKAQRNYPAELRSRCAQVPFGACVCGSAAASRTILFAGQADHTHELCGDVLPAHGHYSVPIVLGDAVLGVLMLYLAERHCQDDREVAFLEAIANTLAGMILRKRAEEELQESESRFSGVLGMLCDAVISFDEDQRIIIFNKGAEDIFGYRKNEVLGRPLDMLIPEMYRSKHSRHFGDFAASQETSRFMKSWGEIFGLRKNGEEFLAEASISNLKTKGKNITTAVLRDITEHKRAEELRHMLVEYSPTTIYMFDDKMNFIDTNPAGERLLGYSREELLGMSIPQVDADPEAVKPAHEQLNRGEPIINYEHKLRHKDGRIITVLNNSVALKDARGKVTNWYSFLMDITERKKAEQLIQEKNRVLEMLSTGRPLQEVLKALNLMIEAQVPDTRSSILILDNSGKHLLSGSAPNLPEAYSTALDGVAIGPSVGSCGTAAYKDKTVIVEDIATDPLWEDYKDLALAHGLMACWSVPIHSSEEKVLGTFALYPDKPRCPDGAELELIATAAHIAGIAIERRRVEERLRKLSQAVEQAGESVLITDRHGAIEYVNPAFTEITGYTPEDVIGKDPSILKSDAQDPSYYKDLWETITRGEVWHGTLIDRKKDGSFYPALMSVAPIHSDGEITHYVGIQQDMTEHQRLEEQFQQAQKMEAIGTLVGGIAHDFNNMLAGIMGNTYLAKLKIDDKAKATEKLEGIESLSMRAADMINQLLTFARKDKVEMNVISLNPFLNKALKLARSGISEYIKLSYQIGPDDLMIRGDATQLQQVIMNLLNNARDAVSGVSQPSIDCELHVFTATDEFRQGHPDLAGDHFARLTVRDNGCGISEDKVHKVFEPFFTTKGVGKGTGLGLSMAYGAIQSHGGVIEVESEVDKGTAFHIYLPLQEQAEKVEVVETSVAVKGHGETILLVDDEDYVRQTGADVLSALGYEVLEAADGRQALEAYRAKQDSIDLVIMDVVMPEMGGVEAAKQMREISPELPVIFATGYDKEAALDDGEELANSTVLSKPFTAETLSQSIHSMLESMK